VPRPLSVHEPFNSAVRVRQAYGSPGQSFNSSLIEVPVTARTRQEHWDHRCDDLPVGLIDPNGRVDHRPALAFVERTLGREAEEHRIVALPVLVDDLDCLFQSSLSQPAVSELRNGDDVSDAADGESLPIRMNNGANQSNMCGQVITEKDLNVVCFRPPGQAPFFRAKGVARPLKEDMPCFFGQRIRADNADRIWLLSGGQYKGSVAAGVNRAGFSGSVC
jgi:hypothetical protein